MLSGNERRNGAAEHWLQWLPDELARRGSSGSRFMVLWDVLEDWFASDDFQTRIAGGLIGGVELPGPGHPEHAAVAANRHSLRRLMQDLAEEVGAPDPGELASQLQMLFEGAVIGALIDGQPQVARVARQLALVALAASAGARPGGQGQASATAD
jgi:hypothetical protein